MKVKTKVLAILLALTSTAAWAQEAVTTTTTTETTTTTTDVSATKSTQAYSLFPESSVSVWTQYFLNKAGKTNNFLVFTPHFTTPILNNFVTMDIFADLKKQEHVSHGVVDGVYADFTKTFVDNENLLIAPYVELVNPFREKGGQALLYFVGELKTPISTADGVVTPFLFTESAVGINTTDAELKTTYTQNQRPLTLTGDELQKKIESENVEAPTLDEKYVYSVYGRVGFKFEPAAVKGLKLTAATNIIANPENNYIMDIDQKKVVDVDTHWKTITQPMFRVEYTFNDQWYLRNDTTCDFENYFGDVTEKQKVAGKISNYSRLIYTLY